MAGKNLNFQWKLVLEYGVTKIYFFYHLSCLEISGFHGSQ